MNTSVRPLCGDPRFPVADGNAIGPPTLSRSEFEQIYRDHSQGVYGVSRQLCGSSVAADVAQEVFLRFWQHPDRYDPAKGTLHSLLLTMSHNISVDRIRSEKARQARERRARVADITYAEDDAALVLDERTELLRGALSRLVASERDAIVTAYFGNCTYQEAAIVLNVPEGTLKARIRHGMKQLREEMTRGADKDVCDGWASQQM